MVISKPSLLGFSIAATGLTMAYGPTAHGAARAAPPGTAPTATPTAAATTALSAKPLVSERYPLTVLVINRETRETYAYPPAGVSEFLADPVTRDSMAAFGATSRILPVPEIPKAVVPKAELNSLSEPLATRSAMYVQAVLRGLSPLTLSQSVPWTVAALKVLGRGRAFTGTAEPSASPAPVLTALPAWPPMFPLSMTILQQPELILKTEQRTEQKGETKSDRPQRALLVVIECRSDSPAGVVEQLDFVAFGGPQMTRTMWTREAHDPTYFKRTDEAIAQVAEKFRQRLARRAPEMLEGRDAESTSPQVVLEVSRLLSDALLPDIQKALKGLGTVPEATLAPVGVTSEFVRYVVNIAAEDVPKLKQALQSTPRQQERFAILENPENPEVSPGTTSATTVAGAAGIASGDGAASSGMPDPRLQPVSIQLVPPVKTPPPKGPQGKLKKP